MKRIILLASCIAGTFSVAHAAPEVYGKAFMTLDYIDAELDARVGTEDDDSLQVNSNSSRLGFRGAEPMTDNTDVIYKLEYGIDIDGDDSKNKGFKRRGNYLGLKNDTLGEIRVGYQHSPLDMLNSVLVTHGYWDNLGTDNEEATLARYLTMTDSSRIKNSILWIAPQYGDIPVELMLMYGAEEGFGGGDDDDGFAASLEYTPIDGLTLGVIYDKDLSIDSEEYDVFDTNGVVASSRFGAGDILRGVVSYDASEMSGYPLTLGALYQKADYDRSNKDEKGYMVSAELGLDNFNKPASVYAQYNGASDLYGREGADSNQFVIGGRYFYEKNIIAHAYAGYNKTEFGGVSDNEAKLFAIGTGLEYKF